MEQTDDIKNKHSNIFITIILVAGILIVAAALSIGTMIFINSQKQQTQNFTASYITSEVVKKMNYENLSEISAGNISKYYEIPDGIVSDCSMFVSTRPDTFTQIACFKLTEEKYKDKLMSVIDDYIADQLKTYQNVNENAYSAVSKSKTDVHYPYVFVSLSSDSEAAVNAFETILGIKK